MIVRVFRWLCCCAVNECYDPEAIVKLPGYCTDTCPTYEGRPEFETSPADACLQVQRDVDDDSALCRYNEEIPDAVPSACIPLNTAAGVAEVAQCAAQPESLAACQDAGPCRFRPERPPREASCVQSAAVSVDCESLESRPGCAVGTCSWTPAVFHSATDLPESSYFLQPTTTAKTAAMCPAEGSYQDYVAEFGTAGAASTMSRTGEPSCIDKEFQLGECANAWAASNQLPYVIFILVFFPIQLLMGYVGWIMPDLYMEAVESDKETASGSTENPSAEQEEI